MTPSLISEHTSAEFDTPWKVILTHFFQSFMEFCLSEVAEQIDWSQGYETLDKELQKIVPDARTGKRIADMFFKIKLKNGQEKGILIHLEIQAQKQERFSHRMFTYYYRAYDRYQKPIVSVALLLDEDLTWRPSYFEMKDPFKGQPFLKFHYRVIKLLDYASKKDELNKGKDLFSLVLLAQLAVMETKKNPELRLQQKMALARELRKRGLSREATSELYKFFDWIMILPDNLMLTYKEQIKQMEEGDAAVWHTPYVSTIEKVARIEGRQEGRQEGLREVLDRQLRRRFPHAVTAEHLYLISGATSDTLAMWMEKLIDATSIDDIFKS